METDDGMGDALQYETSEREGTIHVTLHGRVTYADHPSFRNMITKFRESTSRQLVFDLGDVEFIDSAGLGMLLMVRDSASERNADVVLRGAKGQVQRIFTSSKFETLFNLQN